MTDINPIGCTPRGWQKIMAALHDNRDYFEGKSDWFVWCSMRLLRSLGYSDFRRVRKHQIVEARKHVEKRSGRSKNRAT